MKVLVIGGNKFIGNYVIDELLKINIIYCPSFKKRNKEWVK